MIDKNNLVKTMELVQTWSTATIVFVLLDSTKQTVQIVHTVYCGNTFICGGQCS